MYRRVVAECINLALQKAPCDRFLWYYRFKIRACDWCNYA